MATLTELHETQYTASRLDRLYFFENFYYIPIVGKGAELFDPRQAQIEVADALDLNEMVLGLKARQIGWTTIGMAYALQDALFFEEHPWLLVSKSEDAAIKMLSKAYYAYDRLPSWMKRMLPRVITRTQGVLEFANGSRIESVPATGSTGRGDSVWGAFLDEVAFMEYAEPIWGAVEPLVYGRSMLVSTANGMGNFFHDIWLDSEQPDTAWHGMFYPWSAVPERDEEWYEKTKRAYRAQPWLFFQEYPSTPQEAFAKSGRVAFDATVINECFESLEPAKRFAWDLGNHGPRELSEREFADIEITIWKEPTVLRDADKTVLRKPNYVLGADIAEGLEHGDYTYLCVMDANTGEQVASSKSSIPIAYLDELLEWLGLYYYKALIIPEHNNAGILPIEKLTNDRLYPRVYRMDTFAQIPPPDRSVRFGWRTTKPSKVKMVNDMVLALSSKLILLHDPEFKKEANTFIADGKGGFSASGMNHDDVIMGTCITWQGYLDSIHYPIIWRDTETRPITHDDIDRLIMEKPDSGKNILERSISSRPRSSRGGDRVQKSFIFTTANVKSGGLK